MSLDNGKDQQEVFEGKAQETFQQVQGVVEQLRAERRSEFHKPWGKNVLLARRNFASAFERGASRALQREGNLEKYYAQVGEGLTEPGREDMAHEFGRRTTDDVSIPTVDRTGDDREAENVTVWLTNIDGLAIKQTTTRERGPIKPEKFYSIIGVALLPENVRADLEKQPLDSK